MAVSPLRTFLQGVRLQVPQVSMESTMGWNVTAGACTNLTLSILDWDRTDPALLPDRISTGDDPPTSTLFSMDVHVEVEEWHCDLDLVSDGQPPPPPGSLGGPNRRNLLAEGPSENSWTGYEIVSDDPDDAKHHNSAKVLFKGTTVDLRLQLNNTVVVPGDSVPGAVGNFNIPQEFIIPDDGGCVINPSISSIKFSGDDAKFLNGEVQNYINAIAMISTPIACTQMKDKVVPMINAKLQQQPGLTPMLTAWSTMAGEFYPNYEEPSMTDAKNVTDTKLVQWDSDKFFNALLTWVGNLMGYDSANLDDFNARIQSLLTNGYTTFSRDQSPLVKLMEKFGDETLAAALQDVQLGLGNFTKANAQSSKYSLGGAGSLQNATLAMHMGIDALNSAAKRNLGGIFDYITFPKAPLNEPSIELKVEVSNIDFHGKVAVGLHGEKLGSLDMFQKQNPACLAGCMYGERDPMTFTAQGLEFLSGGLLVDVEKVSISQPGLTTEEVDGQRSQENARKKSAADPLEKQIDDSTNKVIAYFLETYGNMMKSTINCLVGAVGLAKANGAIYSFIHGHNSRKVLHGEHNVYDYTPAASILEYQYYAENDDLSLTTPKSPLFLDSSLNVCPAPSDYTHAMPGVSVGCLLCAAALIMVGFILQSMGGYTSFMRVEEYEDDARTIEMGMPLSSAPRRTASAELLKCQRNERLGLAWCPETPWCTRWGITALLVGNVLLFVSSVTDVATALSIFVESPDGDVYKIPSIFAFTLRNSISDMWSAKVYPFAIFVLLFSGIFPFFKLGLMFLCWFWAPKSRESMLVFLDAVGKVSLLDTFCLVLFLAAFRFTWTTSDGSTVLLQCEVLRTFYVFATATVLSGYLGHVILIAYRLLMNQNMSRNSMVDEKRSGRSLSPNLSPITDRIITLGLPLLAVFTVASSFMDVLSFEFSGAASQVNALAGASNVETLSFWSFCFMLQGLDPNTISSIGAKFLAGMFVLFGFVVPMLFVITLWVLWVVPMKCSSQYWTFVACQTVRAWSALDILVLVFVLASTQISMFANFILTYGTVGPTCSALEAAGISCFGVNAHLHSGAVAMGAAAALAHGAGNVVFKEVRASMSHETVGKDSPISH